MPYPDNPRTTSPTDAKQDLDRARLRFCRTPGNPRVYEWVMDNPMPTSSSSYGNRQMGSASASREVSAARSSQLDTAVAATATLRYRFQQPPKKDDKAGSLDEQPVSANKTNDDDKDKDDNDDDSLAFADLWHRLEAEQAEQADQKHDADNMSKTSSSTWGDVLILVACAIHWATIMAIVGILGVLVIAARTGYRHALRKRA